MTAHRTTDRTSGPGVRDVLRWWPLVLLVTALAVGAALYGLGRQQPSYTATTRLVVTPLAQWDETFIGTSLIRDSGDPKSTATTVAALLDTPRQAEVTAQALGSPWTPASVDSAVSVTVVPESNVIEVQARSTDRARAERLSSEFASAALADRWKTLAAELDARIGALVATTSVDPNAGEASARLQTLTVIRASGTDPTLRIDSSSAAVAERRLPAPAVLAGAVLGGLFVGVLLAVGLVRLRRRGQQ